MSKHSEMLAAALADLVKSKNEVAALLTPAPTEQTPPEQPEHFGLRFSFPVVSDDIEALAAKMQIEIPYAGIPESPELPELPDIPDIPDIPTATSVGTPEEQEHSNSSSLQSPALLETIPNPRRKTFFKTKVGDRCIFCCVGIRKRHTNINDVICDRCHYSDNFDRILSEREFGIISAKSEPLKDNEGDEVFSGTGVLYPLESFCTPTLKEHAIRYLLRNDWWMVEGAEIQSPIVMIDYSCFSWLVEDSAAGLIGQSDTDRLRAELGLDEVGETGVMDDLLDKWKLLKIPVVLHRFTVNDGFYIHGTIQPALDQIVQEADTLVPSRRVVFVNTQTTDGEKKTVKSSHRSQQEDLLMQLVIGGIGG